CLTDPDPTHLYTLSLHDALPIYDRGRAPVHRRLQRHLDAVPRREPRHDEQAEALGVGQVELDGAGEPPVQLVPLLLGQADAAVEDRKSTRLNSSHVKISYAVFCL